MYRVLLVLALLFTSSVWAAPRTLSWGELIPEGAPPPPPPAPLHQGSMKESGHAALHQTPNEPVEKAMKGQ